MTNYFFIGRVENWWDSNTEENYEKRAKCVIDQFNNFEALQVRLNLNGVANQAEAIPDIGGVKAAYIAYCKIWDSFLTYEFVLISINPFKYDLKNCISELK